MLLVVLFVRCWLVFFMVFLVVVFLVVVFLVVVFLVVLILLVRILELHKIKLSFHPLYILLLREFSSNEKH